ncbi:MAG: glycoside hydrolase family 9 protein [Ignavibacteriales bacterium]|nr:glycoside hydrolase family 9 protein [Ignavibacteriales bacterium]
MKKSFILWFVLITIIFAQKSWIRVNQLGYLEKSIKVAVFLSKENTQPSFFELCDALTGETIWKGEKVKSFGIYGNFISSSRLDFSEFQKTGAYYIQIGEFKSPIFRIANDVYNGTADFLLRYMRQQQSGYNPFLKDSCHTQDGFIIYHPTLDSTHINVFGGWHDATDYLQYVTTSANAVFQMLFAYQQNPSSFKDDFDKDGNPGLNGIPDIVDQAKWGLDWLVKMNPSADLMFNQLADDRDHVGFRLPINDKASYGKNTERPVYFCSGKPQGVFKYKNRADGVASTAGKFASAFALGSQVIRKYYPEFSEMIRKKSIDAYNLGKKYPGVCQTAPCKSPYFYEEDNYVDDMELAASQLYQISGDKKYIDEAQKYGNKEPVTLWMGADTASHYQWYPFLNLGHYFLGKDNNKKISKTFTEYFKKGIENVYQKGKTNPFLIGIPFIWCSNNLVAAMLTQSKLYYEITGDSKYQEMEAALRDWLFGCNPWGTSMIIGLPEDGDYPDDPHSSIQIITKRRIDGGLIDGPVYSTIFNKLEGLKLASPDEYADVQPGRMVYHDDYGDYSTNEPTMDGTASLTYYLSALQGEGEKSLVKKIYQFDQGGIIRTDRSKKEIHLLFTGGDFAEGGSVIRRVLKKHKIKAHFFFTGDFYRKPELASLIYNLKNDGHYLGAHSDKHLLYAPWEKRDSLLVTRDEFISDLKANYAEMEKFKIKKKDAFFFIPPYEWYNQKISDWCKEIGIQLINFSPGTSSNADYTTPDMPGYKSSDEIYNRILDYEKNNVDGLNGFILLTHIGTDARREDKFYNKLDNLITDLKKKGYKFTLLQE